MKDKKYKKIKYNTERPLAHRHTYRNLRSKWEHNNKWDGKHSGVVGGRTEGGG